MRKGDYVVYTGFKDIYLGKIYIVVKKRGSFALVYSTDSKYPEERLVALPIQFLRKVKMDKYGNRYI